MLELNVMAVVKAQSLVSDTSAQFVQTLTTVKDVRLELSIPTPSLSSRPQIKMLLCLVLEDSVVVLEAEVDAVDSDLLSIAQ